MQGSFLIHREYWRPLQAFGFEGRFFELNSDTLINTWVALGVIVMLIILARIALRREDSMASYVVCLVAQSFKDLVVQNLGAFYFGPFAFVASLFSFILVCNVLSIIPGLEEPTSDLSTTLALGLTSFFYVQISSVQANGLLGYGKHFFKPFALMFPINVIESLAKIISISFRLFGNIFGIFVISKLYLSAVGGSLIWETIGMISGLNILITLFFVIFDGGIQAFVFSVLSLTYLSLELKHEDA